MDGILPVSVCVDEVDGGFHVRCDRLGDHSWKGRTADEALEEFARDVRDIMGLYWANKEAGGKPGREPAREAGRKTGRGPARR